MRGGPALCPDSFTAGRGAKPREFDGEADRRDEGKNNRDEDEIYRWGGEAGRGERRTQEAREPNPEECWEDGGEGSKSGADCTD